MIQFFRCGNRKYFVGGKMDQGSILVVEDNDRLRKFMVNSLRKENYQVYEAANGKSAFEILRNSFLDLILLDLKLGNFNGIDILQTVRRQDEQLPVIIVSSMTDRDIKVDGFKIGCDDFITKPFYIDELLGRVRRLLKRSSNNSQLKSTISERLERGPFVIDINSLSVYKNGVQIPMRKKLFKIFLQLIRHPDTIFSNEQLHAQIWDSGENQNDNNLYVHIRQLRTLIEDDHSRPCYIKTVRKFGYMFTLGE